MEVDCAEVLDEALEALATTIENAGAKIVSDSLPTVWGDRAELLLLFENLLDNAIKFRAKEPLRIRISAAQEQEEWCFSVRDNGIGIHLRQQRRIFEIFQRLHTREEYPGAGLGLAICARIVLHHGGRIWVKSRPSLGSTFHFTIPVAPKGEADPIRQRGEARP